VRTELNPGYTAGTVFALVNQERLLENGRNDFALQMRSGDQREMNTEFGSFPFMSRLRPPPDWIGGLGFVSPLPSLLAG
jgi:hypothetical protein